MTPEEAKAKLEAWACDNGLEIFAWHDKIMGEHFPMHGIGVEARDADGCVHRNAIVCSVVSKG